MKPFLITLIALQTFATVAVAESIVSIVSSPQGRYVADLEGNRLENGNLVLVGSFENESALTAALPVEELMALAGWETFGSTVTSTIIGNAGKIAADVINDTPLAESFSNRQVFIWVFNSDTVFGATQYGIFTAYNAESNWLFPQVGGIADQVLINMNDTAVIAALGQVNGNELMLTGMIPEPMSYAVLLAAGSLLGIVAQRRRLKKMREDSLRIYSATLAQYLS